MYFIKTPWYLKTVYPSLVWNMPASGAIYLTFDDGPVPGVTDRILEILDAYQAKASFFCIGDNIAKHRALFEQITAKGHTTGNHTYHHVNGWRMDNAAYVREVADCCDVVRSTLFRPPYGRIGYLQIQELRKHFNIVMWDVISGDFDITLSAADCVRNVIDNTQDGSIVVFHDSLKAADRVLHALPEVLSHFRDKGFSFLPLPDGAERLPKGLHGS